MTWLAFDVGCLECGEVSSVVGVFSTKEKAEAAAEQASKEQRENWTGQHAFKVFELPEVTS